MEHRRPGHGQAGGPLAGESPVERPGEREGERSAGRHAERPGDRPRPAPPAGSGGAGDTRVAGPPPVTPAMDEPGPVPGTAPGPLPGKGAPAAPPAGTGAPSRAETPERPEPGGQSPPTDGTRTPPSAGTPASSPAGTDAPSSAGAPERLLDPAESERFRERWREVQSAFVDDPGESVRKADDLASEAVEALGRAVAEHRRTLSDGAGGGEHPDTERLRLALRGYRDLLDRIFAA